MIVSGNCALESNLWLQVPLSTSFPQPVVTQSSLGEETVAISSKQIGPMCESYLMSFSKNSKAMSLPGNCDWYCGWKTIFCTRTIWKGFGSSSLPSLHSPALMSTSLCRCLWRMFIFHDIREFQPKPESLTLARNWQK